MLSRLVEWWHLPYYECHNSKMLHRRWWMGAPIQRAGCCSKAGREATLNTWLEWLLGSVRLFKSSLSWHVCIPWYSWSFWTRNLSETKVFWLYLVWPWDNDQDVYDVLYCTAPLMGTAGVGLMRSPQSVVQLPSRRLGAAEKKQDEKKECSHNPLTFHLSIWCSFLFQDLQLLTFKLPRLTV